jgi:hypothetical protein
MRWNVRYVETNGGTRISQPKGDRHQRREGASPEPFLLPARAAEITEFAVDLVVPNQVVDPKRHEDEQNATNGFRIFAVAVVPWMR